MTIVTQGRAKQKTMTMARKARVEVRAVVFTRPQLLKALGYDPGKRYGTKRDNCLGRCFQDNRVIWLSLPTSLQTIAHEIMHLVTSVTHNNTSFKNRVITLSRGYAPAQHKPQWYEVTTTTVSKYSVLELTPAAAKKRFGELISRETNSIARKIKE
jgi:hypothetical protein